MKKLFASALFSLALLASSVSVFASPALDLPEKSAESSEITADAALSAAPFVTTAVTHGWDFEDGTTSGWYGSGSTFALTNEGGALKLTYNGTTSGNSYLGHGAVSFDTSDCRYLVFRVRNNTTVSKIRFYYKTNYGAYTYNDATVTGSAASETQAINVPIAKNTDKFITYVYDMSTCPGWAISDGAGGYISHNYTGCMFAPQSTPSSGTLEIESVYFTSTLDELIASGELGEKTQAWDFEDGSKPGISNFGSHAISGVSNGKLGFTYTPGSNGALYVSAQQQNLAEVTKYILIHADREINFKIYYQSNEYNGLSETKTRTTSFLFRDTDGYWMMADFTSAQQYAGILGQYMLAAQAGGTYQIDDIVLTNDYIAYMDNGVHEAHLDLSSQSGGTLSYNSDTGVLTAAASSYYSFKGINATGLSADLFRYVVFVPAEGSSVNSGGVYYCNTANTAHSEDQHVFCKKDADGNAYVRFTDAESYGTAHKHPENWAGKTNAWMIQVYGDIADIYFTNRFANDSNPPSGDAEVEKIMLNVSGTSITTEGGTVTMSALARLTDGTSISAEDVRWATDSVCAAASVDGNGVLTLTGKMNGTVNVTAAFTIDGTAYTKTASVTVSGQSEKITANTIKYMSFGNSIWQHGTVASYGWYSPDGHGMAASALDKDYVHRFIHYLEGKYGEGSVEHRYGISLAGFERSVAASDTSYDYTSLIAAFVAKVAEYQPDVITIQMGENVNTNPTAASYSHAVQALVNGMKTAAPNAKIIITTSFWGGAEKVNGAIDAAGKCGVPVALVHTLTATTEARNANEAIGEYPYNGVATHPGDTGMDNIAKLLYEQANYTLTAGYAEQYTLAPTAITFASSTDAITSAGGTFTFTASVTPAEAAQDVVFSVNNENIASISENGVLTAINDGTVTVTAASRYLPDIKTTATVTVSGQTAHYNVTFNANTSDTVTNMPSTDAWAKAAYTLPTDRYPLRDAYNFVGWSRSADGETVLTDTLSGDTTYYAIWEKAYKWNFNRAGDTMGFEAVNGFNPLVADGVFRAIATGTYGAAQNEILCFASPVLDIDAATVTALTIKMQNETFVADTTDATQYGATPTRVYLTVNTTDGNVNLDKPVTSNTVTTYTFDLTGLSGTITGFSFRPTNIDSSIMVDEIAFARESFTLTYDANAGGDTVIGMPASASVEAGNVQLSEQRPEREGYYFLGYSTDPDAAPDETVRKVDIDNDTTVYAVWHDAPLIEDSDETFMTNTKSLNGVDTTGLRFDAKVTDEQYTAADEFGFIVTREKIMKYIGANEFTMELAYPAGTVSGTPYVKGIAHGIENGEPVNRIYLQDNGDVVFSGFMYGIPTTNYDEVMVVRPYMIVDYNGNALTVYGKTVKTTVNKRTESDIDIDSLYN